MPTKPIPAVSIIIPMFNTEKYIGETLDSILAQTFQDFEVIVVDDCSTDNSCAVVESYLPKFGDKLQLIKSKKNSNTPGMPRNVGLRYSRGEYLMFVDSDDVITSTAIEELYPIAKKFDADVVYCEKYYKVEIGEQCTTDKNLLTIEVHLNVEYDFVTEPTLVSNDIVERIKDFILGKFGITPWHYFLNRTFFSKHNIHFPNWKYAEDNLFAFHVVCLAGNLVRVPNIFYVHRMRENSINTNTSLEIEVHLYCNHVFQIISAINKFAETFPPLKENPALLYEVFQWFTKKAYKCIAPVYAKIPAWQLYPLIRRELDKIDDKTPLTAFLCTQMNLANSFVMKSAKIIKQMNAQIQKQNQIIQKQNQDQDIQNLTVKIKSLQGRNKFLDPSINFSAGFFYAQNSDIIFLLYERWLLI